MRKRGIKKQEQGKGSNGEGTGRKKEKESEGIKRNLKFKGHLHTDH